MSFIRAIKFICVILWLSASMGSLAATDTGYMQIIHLNVGQGDATLVVGPNGTTILIDAGEPSKARETIIPVLNTLKIEHLDYIVATHFHNDHIGGFQYLGAFTNAATTIYDRGDCTGEPNCFAVPKTTTASGNLSSYGKYKQALHGAYKRVSVDTPLIDLGAGAFLQFVAAGGKVWGQDALIGGSDDENSQSVAMLISYGEFQYFIGGDLTGGGDGKRDLETPLAAIVGDVDVYQSNHHGSPTSNNQTFLQTLQPEVAIISVGNGNRYQLPKRSVLNQFKDLRISHGFRYVFMTNEGNIGGMGPNRDIDAGLVEGDKGFIAIATEHVSLMAAKDHYIINGVIMPTDDR